MKNILYTKIWWSGVNERGSCYKYEKSQRNLVGAHQETTLHDREIEDIVP